MCPTTSDKDPANRHRRSKGERFRRFSYEDLIKRD
jgi:hypothetical protein